MRRALALALALAACGPELNPPRPPPASSELAGGGVWVAYNLGCKLGCDAIRRGDRILAVDDRPVSTGGEVDALGLTGRPVRLRVARHGSGEVDDVTIVAEPNDSLAPIEDAPPLFTIGAAALDRAPAWARRKLFGHAIPALQLFDHETRGRINGRQLHGRASLIVVWRSTGRLQDCERSRIHMPVAYAELQRHADALQLTGVDPYFVPDGCVFGAPGEVRGFVRSLAVPGETGHVPIVSLDTSLQGGIQGGAADIDEAMAEYDAVPVYLVIDRRGIVRFHAAGSPDSPDRPLTGAIEFARRALADGPAPEAAVARR